jgi:FkbM family methyltransferase
MRSALIKSLAARLPVSLQADINRLRYRRQMARGQFVPDEPEIAAISRLISPGDVVVDVGANIGHYTVHLSRCVGAQGRVIAIEPIAETFAMLSHNVCALKNVTLMNLAIAEAEGFVAMDQIDDHGSHRVMCMRLDSLQLPRVRLIKIDAEGHDLGVLKSAERLISRDRPALIVEAAPDSDVARWIEARGYRIEHTPGSPNIVGVPGAA